MLDKSCFFVGNRAFHAAFEKSARDACEKFGAWRVQVPTTRSMSWSKGMTANAINAASGRRWFVRIDPGRKVTDFLHDGVVVEIEIAKPTWPVHPANNHTTWQSDAALMRFTDVMEMVVPFITVDGLVRTTEHCQDFPLRFTV